LDFSAIFRPYEIRHNTDTLVDWTGKVRPLCVQPRGP